MKIVVFAPVHKYDDIRVFKKEAVTLAADPTNEVVLYARTPDGLPLSDSGVKVRAVTYANRLARFALLPKLARAAFAERADVYHLHNPDTLPIAFVLRAAGKRVIYDTHEDFRTEILLRGWLPRSARRPAAALVAGAERLAGACLDAVIVTQEQIRARIPQAVVIGNPPLVDRVQIERTLADDPQQITQASEPIVLGFVGGLSADRGLFRMMHLVAQLNDHTPTRLLLIGYPVNDSALDHAMTMPEWEFVDYRGELAQDEAFAAIAGSRAGLILFERTASHETIDPNKIYEYMTLGLPFIASKFPDWEARIGSAQAGIFVDTDTSEGLAAVMDWLQDPARLQTAAHNGLEYVLHTYSWQKSGAPMLRSLYRKVLNER